MKLKHASRAKVLLGIVSALLLALVLQPATAQAASGAAQIYYKADGDGQVDPQNDNLGSNIWYYAWLGVEQEGTDQPASGEMVCVSNLNYTSVATPNANRSFLYWMANVDVYIPWTKGDTAPMFFRRIEAGTKITTKDLFEQYGTIWVARNTDTTFTAYFTTADPCTITYKSDGNGTVDPTSEKVEVGNSPVGIPALEPNGGFEFGYWTANIAVTLDNDDVIEEGKPITTDQLASVVVDQDITITAHFVEKDTDTDPVDPDDTTKPTDKVKPADGTSDKALPKTGSNLPGVGIAIALCAGSVITAGMLFARKRCE